MIDQRLDSALRSRFGQLDAGAPATLQASVTAIPDLVPVPRGLRLAWLGRRPALVMAVVLLAIALVAALVIGSGRLPIIWLHALVPPTAGDPCLVLDGALHAAGIADGFVHSTHPDTTWNAGVCVNDGWDSSWSHRHLLLRRVRTSLGEASALIADRATWTRVNDAEDPTVLEVETWVARGPGLWVGLPAPAAGDDRWVAVAVWADDHFFITTQASESGAYAVAGWVAQELGVALPAGGPARTPGPAD